MSILRATQLPVFDGLWNRELPSQPEKFRSIHFLHLSTWFFQFRGGRASRIQQQLVYLYKREREKSITRWFAYSPVGFSSGWQLFPAICSVLSKTVVRLLDLFVFYDYGQRLGEPEGENKEKRESGTVAESNAKETKASFHISFFKELTRDSNKRS